MLFLHQKTVSKVNLNKKRRVISDKVFKIGATAAGAYVLVIVVLIAFQLMSESYKK